MGQDAPLVCIEYCRHRQTCTWTQNGTHKALKQANVKSLSSASVLDGFWRGFLPEGYPDSVTPDYLAFQAWDSIQALCSYVRGMICSQAILQGIGVGEQAASPLAAVFQFFVRDLAGMLGGVLFAFAQGSDLDIYAKQWRLFADCINNVGYVADLMSPLFPDAFLLLACLGSLARAITGVAGGATRAALTQHFALVGNAADISAKEGSQETATTLIGMVVGMAVLRMASGYNLLIWAIFLLLSVMHIYANVRAARSLQLTSLNPARLEIILAHYLSTQVEGSAGQVCSPEEIAALEPLLPPTVTNIWWRRLSREPMPNLIMGARLSALEGIGERLAALPEDQDERYIVALSCSGAHASVVLRVDCTPEDILEAYAHAYTVLSSSQPPEQRLSDAAIWMEHSWPLLRSRLEECRWCLERPSLCSSPWRAAWGSKLRSESKDHLKTS
ncbi:hypothetical protein CVIRNUC_001720 [Coccomyxa viridis]|uniref:Protein root UVB sensitive 3 n=1 Tax=Coccomyxa viridis TaxID=1274662 RepID=A0AAV1HXD8_9CHLO|nr:hypothetical protein CVIRNUC_001720 [Coccomyxa viridis]